MEDSTKEAIHNYYKLKQKYEMSIKKQKQKIIANPSLNAEQKKQKISQIKKNALTAMVSAGLYLQTLRTFYLLRVTAKDHVALILK